MALYDDYFTNEDKPFAENLNDALLLSNVFDMTVPIQIPQMFSNSTWVSTTSPRKCGVAVLTLKDGLPTGISVGTDSGTGNSTLTGTGTVKLSFYPNFNSFGKFKSMTWENTGTIVVNLKTATGTTIASNISKGNIDNQSSELRTLQEIVIEIVFTNATLKSFEVVMENKQQTRYGAEVGISDVTGLNNQLDSKVNISSIVDNLTSTDTNKPLSAKQGKELKTLVDAKINTSNIADNLTTNDATKVLSAKQGKALNDSKVNISSIVDNLTSTSTTAPLSAKQGKTLNDTKVNVSSIVDNLTSTSTTAPLSAKQGKTLNDTKVNVSDIKDNLTSTDTNKPLSAKQGKVLNDTKLNTSNLFNLVYPVGSIYMSVNSTSPATLFGGTWEQIKDTFLLSSGDTYNNGATGGSATVSLTQSQMPRHTHTQNQHTHSALDGTYFVETNATSLGTGSIKRQAGADTNGNFYWYSNQSSAPTITRHTSTAYETAVNKYTGGSGSSESASNGSAHENMPPFLVVNVWKRTA